MATIYQQIRRHSSYFRFSLVSLRWYFLVIFIYIKYIFVLTKNLRIHIFYYTMVKNIKIASQLLLHCIFIAVLATIHQQIRRHSSYVWFSLDSPRLYFPVIFIVIKYIFAQTKPLRIHLLCYPMVKNIKSASQLLLHCIFYSRIGNNPSTDSKAFIARLILIRFSTIVFSNDFYSYQIYLCWNKELKNVFT